MKLWIDFNTNKRNGAKNDFARDMFKLMNNAVYGKTMGTVRNHINGLRPPEHRREFRNASTTQTTRAVTSSHDELAGVEKTKTILACEV